MNRATLFAIEIEASKSTNEYIGHYLTDKQTKVVIISKKIALTKCLNAKENTLQLDDNNIMTITKQLCTQLKTLNDKGFLHNNLHLGNFIVKKKKNKQNQITTKINRL